MTKKIWVVKFIAGNPNIFTKVRCQKPALRSKAISEAKDIAKNRWVVWVEHFETGEKIFESSPEGYNND